MKLYIYLQLLVSAISLLCICSCTNETEGENITFCDCRIEFNVDHEGEQCIGIYATMNVTKETDYVLVWARVYDEDGITPHKDVNGRCQSSGNVVVYEKYPFNKSMLNKPFQVSLFLPNDETHPYEGQHNYIIRLQGEGEDCVLQDEFEAGRYAQTLTVELPSANDDDELQPLILPDPTIDGDWNTVCENDDYDTSGRHFVFGANGIEQEWWEHEDGSTTIRCRIPCYSCNGSNICNICQGTGNGYISIGRYMPCPACGATGSCGTCKGRGYMEMVKRWRPGEAEAYLSAHREVEREYRRQGGTRTRDRGIRVKQYSPNYTGKVERVWCDECQSWDNPHIHFWKR